MTHDFGAVGTYTIAIQGAFPRIYFNDSLDCRKIISIDQWGSNAWASMKKAFMRCDDLQGQATDVPNLSLVTSTASMFHGASSFNQDIGNWDVSNVTDMSYMFYGFHIFTVTGFNQPIGNWDVSNVTNMSSVFYKVASFNQDIGNWDVSNVQYMSNTFFKATSFNQNIGNWDINNVTNMYNMLNYAGLSLQNYDNTLIGWESQGFTNKTLGANNLYYCNADSVRNRLINTYGWTINGDTYDCTVNVDNQLSVQAFEISPNPT